jgi:hypothetical protein
MAAFLRYFGHFAVGGLALVVSCSSDENTGRKGDRTIGTSNPGTGGAPPVVAPPAPGPVTMGGGNGQPIDVPTGTGGTGGICNELTIVPTPVVPTVLIVVDQSSSMFEPQDMAPWDLLYSTLMADDGAVKTLQDKVRFGFTSFKGNPQQQMNESGEDCAEMGKADFALNNYDAINTEYKALGAEWMPGIKWETPTGHALTRATAQLAAFTAVPDGPKNILLVTDGNPNTCQIVDPQCGQDLSIKAAQDAFTAGIRTYVIGIGDVIEGNVGCEPRWGHCGRDHLADLANAGVGLPVAPQPMEYPWQSCADAYTPPRELKATYDTTGMPGDAPFYTAKDQAQLTAAIAGLLNNVLSCTVQMNALVTGDASLGRVDVNGTPAVYQAADGWSLEADNRSVTLAGKSCDAFKASGQLHISFPCIPGKPVVIPID